MTSPIWLIVAALVAWLWASELRARETALRVCRDACERHAVQLLDGSVALARMRWRRVEGFGGRACLVRQYRFYFSAEGIDRRLGELTLCRLRVLALDMPLPRASSVH